jgi:hypothetical protein
MALVDRERFRLALEESALAQLMMSMPTLSRRASSHARDSHHRPGARRDWMTKPSTQTPDAGVSEFDHDDIRLTA